MSKCPLCGGKDGQHYELNWGEEFLTFLCGWIFIFICVGILLIILIGTGIIK